MEIKSEALRYLEVILKQYGGDPEKPNERWAKYLNTISQSGKFNDIETHYQSDTDTMHMVNYLWQQKEFHAHYKHEESKKPTKDDELAAMFVEEAITAYTNKKYHACLKNLNLSILLAPHGEMPRNTLATGFAVRSKVLYEMKQYERSMADCKRAMENGYSDDKKSLHVRENNCRKELKELARPQRPRRGSRQAKASTSREPKSDVFYPCCTREIIKPPENDTVTTEGLKYSNLFSNNDYKCPALIEENPKVPSLTSAADIGYSEEKGHHIYATRDILPGEVVIKEECFSFLLLSEGRFANCDYCGIPMVALIPCPSCIMVSFCSENCLNIAQDSFHNAECKLLPSILDLEVDGKTVLYFRTIIKEEWPSLKEQYIRYREEQSTKKPEELGYDESGVFRSESFTTLFHVLNGERIMKKPFDILRRCCTALMMLKSIVIQGKYFGQVCTEMPEELTDDLLILADILAIVNIKVFSILPYYQQNFKRNITILDQEKYGIGLCTLCPIFRHSCDPSIIHFNYGRFTVFRAVKFIDKGSDLNVCYVASYTAEDLASRTSLLEDIGVTCNCIACTEDWQIPDGKELFILQCPQCKSELDRKKGCLKCKKGKFTLPAHVTGDCLDRDVDVESLYSYVKRTINTTKSTLQSMESNDDLQSLQNSVALCTIFTKPSLKFLDFQELLKIIYVMKSYHTHYLKETTEITGCSVQ